MIYFNDDEIEIAGIDDLDSLTLEDFLAVMDKNYQQTVKKIDLFNPALTAQWTHEQKALFVRLFYHARGHFYRFLWYMGSLTQDPELKKNVLYNISEEFGEKGKSHEHMYLDFASSLGVDLLKEIYEEKFYLDFLREFNRNHLQWIVEKKDVERLCLFAAYERLDNVDYLNLLDLVKSIGVSKKEALLFFVVHSRAGHFKHLFHQLSNSWVKNRSNVISAFQLIYNNQLILWKNLSALIQAHRCETSSIK